MAQTKDKVKFPLESEFTGEMEKRSCAPVHRSGRRSKGNSRHEHKCHKARHKSAESLLEKGDRIRGRHALTEKGNWSRLSLDSGLSQPETFPPLEINVGLAYEHVKEENAQLKAEVKKLQAESEGMRTRSFQMEEENENLRADVALMKNLVFKLNVELERYQNGGKVANEERQLEKLPENYQKDFLKPILPLLKAYSEALLEKDDVLNDLEKEYRKFNKAFNEVLAENEKLYEELEKKFSGPDGDALSEIRTLRKNLEMAKQENDLLYQQINLEREKLTKVHSLLKVKVEEASKEKEDLNGNMEECKADLYLLRGKYTVLKQEFERLKLDNDTRVPLAVHSASINECRKLFEDLKIEYENEKQRLMRKIKDQEVILKKYDKQEAFLERSNFDQNVEIEGLRKKIQELEKQRGRIALNEGERKKLSDSQRQLRESNRKVEELSNKLSITRKQLQKAMIFAEDIVRGQEGLLLQLHAKQKENTYMATQFGSLKMQLKNVEKGAQEGLNSIEEKIRSLEAENHSLVTQNRKLERLLAEKEMKIRHLEPTKDS